MDAMLRQQTQFKPHANEENIVDAETRQESPVEYKQTLMHRMILSEPPPTARQESPAIYSKSSNVGQLATIKTEKRKRGRPRGSKNKSKTSTAMKPL